MDLKDWNLSDYLNSTRETTDSNTIYLNPNLISKKNMPGKKKPKGVKKTMSFIPKQIQDFQDEVLNAIGSSQPLIHIKTDENERARKLLESVAQKCSKKWIVWHDGKGFCTDKQMVPNTHDILLAVDAIDPKSNNIYVFYNIEHYFDRACPSAETLISKIDIKAGMLSDQKAMMLLISQANLPAKLSRFVWPINLPLPDEEVIEKVILSKLQKAKAIVGNKSEISEIARTCLGLYEAQIENILAYVYYERGKPLNRDCFRIIMDKKIQEINQSEILELVPRDDNIKVGGQKYLDEWLDENYEAFGEEGREKGMVQPKGILLFGVPGCGKSHRAKEIAKRWNLPLIKINFGRLLGKYFGESEARLEIVLKTIDAFGAVVIWIDEIEKVLGTNYDSHEVTLRLLNRILTWLQDRKSRAFLVATANSIEKLPTELIREGRFDKIFFLELPNLQDRQDILRIHLEKKGLKFDDASIERFARACPGATGSEMENAIEEAKRKAHHKKIALNVEIVEEKMRQIKPVSVLKKDDIERQKSLIRDKAMSASDPYNPEEEISEKSDAGDRWQNISEGLGNNPKREEG